MCAVARLVLSVNFLALLAKIRAAATALRVHESANVPRGKVFADPPSFSARFSRDVEIRRRCRMSCAACVCRCAGVPVCRCRPAKLPSEF